MFWSVVNDALAAEYPSLLPGVPHRRPAEPGNIKWLDFSSRPESTEAFLARTLETALVRVVHHLRWKQPVEALALSTHLGSMLGWHGLHLALTAIDGGAGAGAQLPAKWADRLACWDQLTMNSISVNELNPDVPSVERGWGGQEIEGRVWMAGPAVRQRLHAPHLCSLYVCPIRQPYQQERAGGQVLGRPARRHSRQPGARHAVGHTRQPAGENKKRGRQRGGEMRGVEGEQGKEGRKGDGRRLDPLGWWGGQPQPARRVGPAADEDCKLSNAWPAAGGAYQHPPKHRSTGEGCQLHALLRSWSGEQARPMAVRGSPPCLPGPPWAERLQWAVPTADLSLEELPSSPGFDSSTVLEGPAFVAAGWAW